MKSFREFFGPYLGEALPEKVGEGILRSLEIDNENRQITVKVAFLSPVEREKIDTLLQCAVHAPSAMNRQTWHFSAVLNREKIAKLAVVVGKALGNEKYDMYKPAALIIPSNELIGDTGITSWDNACALENIFLAAHSMGLGTVWINQLSATCDVPEVRAVLTEFGVPENHKVFGIAAIGYAAAETPVKEKKFPVTYVE